MKVMLLYIHAWANLSRHYYNIQNRDSLIYWSHKIDSLAATMRFQTHYSMHEDSFAKWIYGTQLWVSNERGDQPIQLCPWYKKWIMDWFVAMKTRFNLSRIHRDSDAIVAYRERSRFVRNRWQSENSRCNTWETSSNLIFEPNHFTEAKELLTRYDEMIQDRENERARNRFPRGSLPCVNVCFLCG